MNINSPYNKDENNEIKVTNISNKNKKIEVLII